MGEKNTTFIDCDQSVKLCQVNATGDPQCVDLSRGAGVNCTTDAIHDEYYCQNDLTSGVAECIYPPKHDCYESSCTGKDAFNTTVIDCDQSSNRCGFNDTGSPLCINTTRGAGIDSNIPLLLISTVVKLRSEQLNVSLLLLIAATIGSAR